MSIRSLIPAILPGAARAWAGLAAICISIAVPPATLAQRGPEVRSVNNGDSGQPVPHTPMGGDNRVSFVDLVQYNPEGDKDFAFDIRPLAGLNAEGRVRYTVSGWDGNRDSHVFFRINSWELPDFVEVLRLPFRTGVEPLRIPIERGTRAVPIVELLGYRPNGDHDFSYNCEVTQSPNNIWVSTRTSSGNSGSFAQFRLTVLSFPADRDFLLVQEERTVTMRDGLRHIRMPFRNRMVFTPLRYEADGDDNFAWTMGARRPEGLSSEGELNINPLRGNTGSFVTISVTGLDWGGILCHEDCR